MKKRIFALLLTLMMCIAASFAVSADTLFGVELPESHEVHVPSVMKVRHAGTDSDWSDAKNELQMSKSDMTNGKVDFMIELNTSPIKQATIEWYEFGEDLIDTIASTEFQRSYLSELFKQYTVTGSFTVHVTYPAQFEIPADHIDGTLKSMVGFNSEASLLFHEKSRTVDYGADVNTINIVIEINDFFPEDPEKDGIAEQSLYDGLLTGHYLDKLHYILEDVKTGEFSGALDVVGRMEGETNIQIGNSNNFDDQVRFYTSERVAASVIYNPVGGDGSGTGSGTGGGAGMITNYKIIFNIDGDTSFIAPMHVKAGNVSASKLPIAKKPGYKFDGWYLDSAMTEKVGSSINVNKDITLYGRWLSDTLLNEDHFAYVIGYPDETIRPNNNITREEATMIFYRLLRDDVREAAYTTTNSFGDIAPERWSNSAISTMANGGYVVGRPDGNFDPEANITRAEFATMAVRFASLMDVSGASFSDIEGHWAETFILKASTATWINGYPDGTFKPNAYITRAEAMTLVNNVLCRHVNAEGLHANTRLWIDIKENDWYYYIVLEATNSHNYVRQEDGVNETWTEITPNKEWK